MPSNLQQELRDFHGFIGRLLSNGHAAIPVEETVAEFRAYQDELERCREAIRPALEASRRGEGSPLVMQDIIDQVSRRLRSEGITD